MPEFDSYNPSHPKMFEADCLNSGIAGSVDYTPGGSHSFRYDLYAGTQDGCLIRFLLSVCRSHFESFPSDRALIRSEEHTSELQSRGHLVCRLLLEKKKTD